MSKKGCFWIALILLVLFGIGAASCGGLAYFGYGMITAPFDALVAELNETPEVVDKLGSPITRGPDMTFNNYENVNGNGSTELGTSLVGPMGTADAKGEMTLTNNVWRIKRVTVTFEDGSSIELPVVAAPAADQPDDPSDPDEAP